MIPGLRLPEQAPARPVKPGAGHRRAFLAVFGAPALAPVAFMLPSVILYSTDTMHSAGNDVLGTGGAILLLATLAVTPAVLLTGSRRAAPLRQWYGIMFSVTIVLDAVLAATDSSFAGGVAGRLAGHAFLLTGFTMVLLSVPLLLTAGRPAMKRLGRYWRPVQRYGTYAIWALLPVHLAILEGFGYDRTDRFGVFHQRLYEILVCSLPLLVLRLPPVTRWVKGKQAEGKAWQVRLTVIPLILLFAVGYFFLLNEEIYKGVAAFVLNPVND